MRSKDTSPDVRKTKLEKAYEEHEKKIFQLVDSYKLYRQVSHEIYIRSSIFRRLLKRYMSDDEINEALNEYRSSLDNQLARNQSNSSGAILDGMGDEAGYTGER